MNFSDKKLAKPTSYPFPVGCESELYLCTNLGPNDAQCYQATIGVLQCMVKLGRIITITNVNSIVALIYTPNEGHLANLLRGFAILKINYD